MVVLLLLAASTLWDGAPDGVRDSASPGADGTDAALAGRARPPGVDDSTVGAVAERSTPLGPVLRETLRRVAVNNTVVVTTASKDFERYVVCANTRSIAGALFVLLQRQVQLVSCARVCCGVVSGLFRFFGAALALSALSTCAV